MEDNPCPICKKSLNDRHEHVLQPCNINNVSPLAFIVSLQMYYDNTSAHARLLGLARQELKEFFPGKEFEIQPVRMMLRKDGANGVVLGEAYVATYAVFEK